MFAFTIFATYLVAGGTLLVQLDQRRDNASVRRVLLIVLMLAIALHGGVLAHTVLLDPGRGLGFADVIGVIAWLFGAIGLYAALQQGFRAVAGVVLALSAALLTLQYFTGDAATDPLSWQLKLHAALSLVAYSFLAAGCVLAIASLVQDRQLRAARVTSLSKFLPPLMASEQFLATLTTSGFVFLLLSVATGFVFVDDLFAQHLTHKTVLSLAALAIFGALVVGRRVAGWRGRRMLQLYLAGFALLLLAYFGTKVVLEVLLNERWG